jgi:hypothetical protein
MVAPLRKVTGAFIFFSCHKRDTALSQLGDIHIPPLEQPPPSQIGFHTETIHEFFTNARMVRRPFVYSWFFIRGRLSYPLPHACTELVEEDTLL